MYLGLNFSIACSINGRQHVISAFVGFLIDPSSLWGKQLTAFVRQKSRSKSRPRIWSSLRKNCPTSPINCVFKESSSGPFASAMIKVRSFPCPCGSILGFLQSLFILHFRHSGARSLLLFSIVNRAFISSSEKKLVCFIIIPSFFSNQEYDGMFDQRTRLCCS